MKYEELTKDQKKNMAEAKIRLEAEKKLEDDPRQIFSLHLTALIKVDIKFSDKAYEKVSTYKTTGNCEIRTTFTHAMRTYVLKSGDQKDLVFLAIGLIKAERARKPEGELIKARGVKMFLRSIEINEKSASLRCCVYQDED